MIGMTLGIGAMAAVVGLMGLAGLAVIPASRDPDREEREDTLRAFGNGGSVMYQGKVYSRAEDLPSNHPVHAEKSSGTQVVNEGSGDNLLLSRIAELESHLKAAYANIDAVEASRRSAESALESAKAERDKADGDNQAAKETLRELMDGLFEFRETDTLPELLHLFKNEWREWTARALSPGKTEETAAQPGEGEQLPGNATDGNGGPLPPVASMENKSAPTEEQSSEQSSAGTPLPADFPARALLETAGITTREAVPADADALKQIKGIGDAQSRAILAALSGE